MSWVVKRCPRAAETLRRAGRKEPFQWNGLGVFNQGFQLYQPIFVVHKKEAHFSYVVKAVAVSQCINSSRGTLNRVNWVY